jgi:hypothetical protein
MFSRRFQFHARCLAYTWFGNLHDFFFARDAFLRVVEAYRALSQPGKLQEQQEDFLCRDANAWIQEIWRRQDHSTPSSRHETPTSRTNVGTPRPSNAGVKDKRNGSVNEVDRYPCGCASLFDDLVCMQRIASQNCKMGRIGAGHACFYGSVQNVRHENAVIPEECLTTMIQGSFSKECECVGSHMFPGCVVREANCVGYQGLRSALSSR